MLIAYAFKRALCSFALRYLLTAQLVSALVLPQDNSRFTTSMTSTTSSDDVAANFTVLGDVKCIPRIYGADLSLGSCLNAWSHIPRSNSEETYVTRSQQVRGGITVPIRYQSDDGLCVIDLRPRNKDLSIIGDSARSIAVSDAAGRIIQKCVINLPARSGGSVTAFSK